LNGSSYINQGENIMAEFIAPRGAQRIHAPRLHIAARVNELQRSLSRTTHGIRHRAPRERTNAKLLVLVPSHNEEESIGDVLNALLNQTRPADRIVVICDNCTDRTEEIASRYRGVTVMRTINNKERKVGALNQAWYRYQAGYDYVLGMDADTVLDRECIGQLEAELSETARPGGVMARYTFDQNLGLTAPARMLIRLQRLEFAGWTADALRRNRKTYVLGGQTSLFSNHALRAVADNNQTKGPWDTSTQVEDMQLTGDFKAMGLTTNVSTTARAYAGPMLGMRALWAQRRKWDEGMARLLAKSAPNKWVLTLWRSQFGMASNAITRIGFLFLLFAALLAHNWIWNPLWLIPPAVAMILNLKLAWRVPNRTWKDLLTGVLLVPVELYLVFRIACTAASWVYVLAGIKRDGWAQQAAAESGKSNGVGKVVATMALIALASVGTVVGWIYVPRNIQHEVLVYGWATLAIVTIAQTALMVTRIIRPAHGLRP